MIPNPHAASCQCLPDNHEHHSNTDARLLADSCYRFRSDRKQPSSRLSPCVAPLSRPRVGLWTRRCPDHAHPSSAKCVCHRARTQQSCLPVSDIYDAHPSHVCRHPSFCRCHSGRWQADTSSHWLKGLLAMSLSVGVVAWDRCHHGSPRTLGRVFTLRPRYKLSVDRKSRQGLSVIPQPVA